MFYILMVVIFTILAWGVLEMEDELPKLIAITAVLLLGIIMGWGIFQEKIQECESSLPRNERCVLIAVPEYTLQEKNDD